MMYSSKGNYASFTAFVTS